MNKKKLGNILIIVGLAVIAVFVVLGVVEAIDNVNIYNSAPEDIKKYLANSTFDSGLSGFLYWGQYAVFGIVSAIVGIVLKKKDNK